MSDSDPARGYASTHLDSPTGARLALYRRYAAGAARGVVQVNHGLAEHAGRYADFAERLSARGYHVYAHDHRGHGGTTAPDAPPRMFGGWDKVIGDVQAVRGEIARAHPGLPVVVFGHSMGACVAMNAVMRHPEGAAGAAIWNGNFSLGPLATVMAALVGLQRAILGPRATETLIHGLSFSTWQRRYRPETDEPDWLSRDRDVVRAYVDDPLCGWPSTVSLWGDFLQGLKTAARDEDLSGIRRDMPFHLVGGAADPASDDGRAVTKLAERLARNGFGDVSLQVYEEGRHEAHNDLHKDQVMDEFATWLDRVTGATA